MAQVCISDECDSDCVQLTQRELTVCNLICQSDHPISFGQLKQSALLHQEIVSRIVRRLMIHGLVKRTESGYECHCEFVPPISVILPSETLALGEPWKHPLENQE